MRAMIRTQISLTEDQMRRLRREAHRRRVSLAFVVREAIDQVVPDEDVERARRIETMLAAGGSAASGTGAVARDHDDVLAGDRW
jgi:predicted transcriptional regulator